MSTCTTRGSRAKRAPKEALRPSSPNPRPPRTQRSHGVTARSSHSSHSSHSSQGSHSSQLSRHRFLHVYYSFVLCSFSFALGLHGKLALSEVRVDLALTERGLGSLVKKYYIKNKIKETCAKKGRDLRRGEAATECAGELGAEVEGHVLALLELLAQRGLARLVVDGQNARNGLAHLTTRQPVSSRKEIST